MLSFRCPLQNTTIPQMPVGEGGWGAGPEWILYSPTTKYKPITPVGPVTIDRINGFQSDTSTMV